MYIHIDVYFSLTSYGFPIGVGPGGPSVSCNTRGWIEPFKLLLGLHFRCIFLRDRGLSSTNSNIYRQCIANVQLASRCFWPCSWFWTILIWGGDSYRFRLPQNQLPFCTIWGFGFCCYSLWYQVAHEMLVECLWMPMPMTKSDLGLEHISLLGVAWPRALYVAWGRLRRGRGSQGPAHGCGAGLSPGLA